MSTVVFTEHILEHLPTGNDEQSIIVVSCTLKRDGETFKHGVGDFTVSEEIKKQFQSLCEGSGLSPRIKVKNYGEVSPGTIYIVREKKIIF